MTTTFDVINPATEQIMATVPLTSLADTNATIARIHATTEPWRAVTSADREHLADRTFVLSVQPRLEHNTGDDRLTPAARTKAPQ